jgi:hypothetical protein
VQVLEFKVAPIDPVDPQLAERLHLESPLQMKQTFAYTNYVIKHGMYLESGGKEYAIKGVSPWPEDNGFFFYQLVLEDVVVK